LQLKQPRRDLKWPRRLNGWRAAAEALAALEALEADNTALPAVTAEEGAGDEVEGGGDGEQPS